MGEGKARGGSRLRYEKMETVVATEQKRWVDPLDALTGTHADLNEQEITKAKQVYLVYSPVERSHLVWLLRAMDLTPSFLDIHAAEKKEWDTMDDVVAQLSSFDHLGDGTIDSNEMVSALTTLGDTMTEAQCQKLVALGDARGRISIVVLAKWL